MLINVDNVVFTIVFAVFIALSSAQNAASPFDKLAEHFFYKCSNLTKANTAFDKLYADSVEFKKDLQYAFTFIPQEKRTFCDSHRRLLEGRVAEISNDLKPCLAAKEKHLAEFLRDSFREFMHFLCHRNGQHIEEFFSPRTATCRSALENGESAEIGGCFTRIFRPASGTPSKKELCEDLTVARRCFGEVLKQRCPTYTPYRTLNDEFFNYVSKPCSSCTFFSNICLLIVSVMLSYFGNKLL